MTIDIGIIGGSGLYDMAELTDREERNISTPFGEPSGVNVKYGRSWVCEVAHDEPFVLI